jgi:acetyl-CoA acetyltransferase
VREVRVLGVGATAFAGAGRGAEQLAREAAAAALADGEVAPAEIGAVTVACGSSDALRKLWSASPPVLRPSPSSAVAALELAYDAVAGGAHDLVLCVGLQATRSGHPPPIDELARAAAEYMRASGASERTFALVAAKNRLHGVANPRALHTQRVDMGAILGSELLTWPLRSLMVASPSEGAAAVVLAAGGRVERRAGARAPRLRACVLVRALGGRASTSTAIARAAGLAYRSAGVGPDDLDCAEVHDITAAGEVAAYEPLQFALDGHGPDLVDSGFTALGGVLPVNTSGGSLAQGDAPGAAAVAQVCELTWQLRGEAGRRQVPGARAALALGTAPDTAAAHVGVAILTRG